MQVADVSVVRPVGDLDLATAPQLRIALDALLGSAQRHVVVDMSEVDYLDCAAISVLILARSRAETGGGSLRVAARPAVLAVLRITGTEKALGAAAPLAATLHAVPARRPGEDRGEKTAELLLRVMWTVPPDAPERAALRAAAIEAAMPFAAALAHRYRDRGESADDLAQVAALGLVKAVDRYDPRRGADFAAYAAPTILGEVRRHFRDNAWHLHVPRRMQDLRVRAVRAQGALAQRLGRSPSAADLAGYLAVPVADVLAALAAARAYAPRSLSLRAAGGGHADRVGEPDRAMDAVDLRATVGPVMARLSERERRILALRFGENLTQAQIGERLGVSQMQVSRHLRRALRTLRTALDTTEAC